MTKREIFDKILEVCSVVCDVPQDKILSGCKKGSVVTARVLLVYWCINAGFKPESLVSLIGVTHVNAVNALNARAEDYWRNLPAFRLIAKDAGRRLNDYANTIGENFNISEPLQRMARVTGRM